MEEGACPEPGGRLVGVEARVILCYLVSWRPAWATYQTSSPIVWRRKLRHTQPTSPLSPVVGRGACWCPPHPPAGWLPQILFLLLIWETDHPETLRGQHFPRVCTAQKQPEAGEWLRVPILLHNPTVIGHGGARPDIPALRHMGSRMEVFWARLRYRANLCLRKQIIITTT